MSNLTWEENIVAMNLLISSVFYITFPFSS